MKVILSKDVPGLGRAGQIKEVSDGHARNFLIKKHLALPATQSMLAKIQKEEAEHEAKVQRLAQQVLEIKNQMEGKTFVVYGKAQGQRLFAAIHEDQIAQAVNKKLNLAILPSQVIIKKAIKSPGLSEAEIKLNDAIHAKIKIEVQIHPS